MFLLQIAFDKNIARARLVDVVSSGTSGRDAAHLVSASSCLVILVYYFSSSFFARTCPSLLNYVHRFVVETFSHLYRFRAQDIRMPALGANFRVPCSNSPSTMSYIREAFSIFAALQFILVSIYPWL